MTEGGASSPQASVALVLGKRVAVHCCGSVQQEKSKGVKNKQIWKSPHTAAYPWCRWCVLTIRERRHGPQIPGGKCDEVSCGCQGLLGPSDKASKDGGTRAGGIGNGYSVDPDPPTGQTSKNGCRRVYFGRDSWLLNRMLKTARRGGGDRQSWVDAGGGSNGQKLRAWRLQMLFGLGMSLSLSGRLSWLHLAAG